MKLAECGVAYFQHCFLESEFSKLIFICLPFFVCVSLPFSLYSSTANNQVRYMRHTVLHYVVEKIERESIESKVASSRNCTSNII